MQEDAGEILAYVYTHYVQGNIDETSPVTEQELEQATGWDFARVRRILDYLEELTLIKFYKFIDEESQGNFFAITGLTPLAISLVEDPPGFKKTFGFEINLGLFKFSWENSEE